MKAKFLLMLLVSMQTLIAHAQTSLPAAFERNPLGYISGYAQHAQKVTAALRAKSMAAIAKLERAERRLIAALVKKDSSIAARMAGGIGQRYAAYEKLLSDTGSIDPLRQYYLAPLDSAMVATRLLQLADLSDKQRAVLSSLQLDLGALQQGLTRTNLLQQALADRMRELRAGIAGKGALRDVLKMTRYIARYKAGLHELRAWANEPDRALHQLLTSLAETSLFKRLFDRYSILASLMPPTPTMPVDALQAGTMQVRNAVMTAVDRTASVTNIAQLVQQPGELLDNPLRSLKDRWQQVRQGRQLDDGVETMAGQLAAKPLHKRLELATSFQTVRSNNYFPATSDLGLSLGYRLNDRSVIGVGASYKMGWGKSYRAIRLSHEGISLRSFLQARIKGSFHATGGWECHYQQPFSDLRLLKDGRAWRQSALLGVMKRVNTGNRLLKSTQFQLLIDMLAINTIHSPIIFRVGYQLTK